MKRRLRQVALAASLLLLAGVLALWLLSLRRMDFLAHPEPGRYAISSACGRILLESMGNPDAPLWPDPRDWMHDSFPLERAGFWAWHHPARSRHGVLGFAYAYNIRPPGRIAALAIPYWLPALLLATPPAVALLRARARRRRARRRAGRCVNCGYDLRATPDRCPECGTAIDDDPTNAPPPLLPLPGTPGRGLGRGASDEPRE